MHQVGSLDEALEALAERPDIRVALFDLAMPGMESAASLSAVRECFPDVLTVVVSGSTDREDVFLALRTGAHGFVPKGSSVEALIQALRMVFDGFVYVPSFVTQGPARPRPSRGAGRTGESRRGPDGVADAAPAPGARLIVAGQSNKEIARSLALGEGTVKIHVAALLKALGVPNRSAAAAWGGANLARQRGALDRWVYSRTSNRPSG